MTIDQRGDVARGYVLLGVFYIHALYALIQSVPDTRETQAAFVQIKLLAPHVSAFFFLSGLGSSNVGRLSVKSIIKHSLMLVLLAGLSHIIGFLISALLYGGSDSILTFVKDLTRPIIYGTGYSTFVAWFFPVLAASRMLAYIFQRSKIVFAASVAMIAMLLWGLQFTGRVPDNLYEWRNWPAAVLFFLIGTRIPEAWRVPAILGWFGLLGTLAVTWFNAPGLLATGLCWDCNTTFVSQPMVGQYGFIPAFLLQELLFLLFLLWISSAGRSRTARRIGAYFGRSSLQFLLLHGWVITAAYPLMTRIMPDRDSPWLFIAILVLNPIVHALLFRLLKGMIDRVIAYTFHVSRRIVTLGDRLLHPARRIPSRP